MAPLCIWGASCWKADVCYHIERAPLLLLEVASLCFHAEELSQEVSFSVYPSQDRYLVCCANCVC